MTRADRIKNVLSVLNPIELIVTNDSLRHKGHAGDDGSGETHFAVHMVSDRFHGMSRIERQRLVMDLLKSEFDRGLHALGLWLDTPGQK